MPIEISGGGSGGGGSGTVTNVSSANTAISVATPTTTPVLTVATLDVLATDGPPAASVPMNSHKLTGLAAGTTNGDSVRYEQVLLSGAVTAADTSIVVGGTGVAPTIRTNTLDVIAADHAPAADWSNNSHKITNLANGSSAQDAAAFGQIPSGTQLVPASPSDAGQFLDGAATPAWAYPPGHEIGYDQITSPVSVSSTTEATPTTVISCAAHTFDGAAVLLTVFAPYALPASGQAFYLLLFESTTEITRLGTPSGSGTLQVPVTAMYRFTPSAGSHTYTIAAFVTGSAGTFGAGAGGVTAFPPAFARFTKV